MPPSLSPSERTALLPTLSEENICHQILALEPPKAPSNDKDPWSTLDAQTTYANAHRAYEARVIALWDDWKASERSGEEIMKAVWTRVNGRCLAEVPALYSDALFHEAMLWSWHVRGRRRHLFDLVLWLIAYALLVSIAMSPSIFGWRHGVLLVLSLRWRLPSFLVIVASILTPLPDISFTLLLVSLALHTLTFALPTPPSPVLLFPPGRSVYTLFDFTARLKPLRVWLPVVLLSAWLLSQSLGDAFFGPAPIETRTALLFTALMALLVVFFGALFLVTTGPAPDERQWERHFYSVCTKYCAEKWWLPVPLDIIQRLGREGSSIYSSRRLD
ncbi:hypothetical protein CYLTODRAFT_420480 [Cylindrobasidium torrendii FP15055 ss-10]|uniref:Uncharacterized protein n=1 Tax=Cylindrobasidium torrendii FP15055 ss-10 TaxID=1314674 RepID=A0A0D7BHJ6_9AGAR|nr:hypothetical protein CYLTODRAFT_420480 [Cylindrobasidium torrendii FP15055 ss-10]